MPPFQFQRYIERTEDELCRQVNSGEISREEYNAAMRDLAAEEREAYEADRQDALDRVDDDWGRF